MEAMKKLALIFIVVNVALVATTEGGEFSKHWISKLMTAFARMDTDGDGQMGRNDFVQQANRFCEVGKLEGQGCDEAKDLFINEIWMKYFKPPNSAFSTTVDFISNLKKAGKDNIEASAVIVYGHYFDNTDRDKNGLLDLNEFKSYLYIWGINKEFAQATFDAIDTSGDGFLSREELVAAGINFSIGENPDKASDTLYGPLVI